MSSTTSEEYWSETHHPFTCLVFLLPLLAAYEAGVLWLGGTDPETLRNGADFWMRGWLGEAGLGWSLFLPGLVVGTLLFWNFYGEFKWRVSADTLAGMLAESLLFAFTLVVVGQLCDFAFHQMNGPPVAMIPVAAQTAAGAPSWTPTAARAVTFLGAGVYEELLFRLCLLPACYGVFVTARLSHRWAGALAILSTSLMFSIAHYVSPTEQFDLFTFSFRAIAGVFFAVIFVLRGFGITVGCHTAYDLVVGVLMAE